MRVRRLITLRSRTASKREPNMLMNNVFIPGRPRPYKRMTQRSKWNKAFRDYFAWLNQIKAHTQSRDVYSPMNVVFYMPLPRRLSQRKREDLHLEPHRVTPDLDNLLKALWDGVKGNDKDLWQVLALKVWVDDAQGGVYLEWPEAPAESLISAGWQFREE